MGIPGKNILQKIAGKRVGIQYHLNEHIPALIAQADTLLVEYWRKEVSRLIDELEEWAGRLSRNDELLAEAAGYRRDLETMLNNRLRDIEE